MIATLSRPVAGVPDFPSWMVRRAPWLLVALHVPFVVAPPLFTITRRPGLPGDEVALLIGLSVVLAALQLRHSLAASRQRRPRWAFASFLAVAALVYVPTTEYTWDWAISQWMVIGSGAMLLRGRLAALAVLGPALGTGATALYLILMEYAGSVPSSTVIGIYYVVILLMGGAALYGSARLVAVVEELDAARTEVAELAVGRERLRVARDVHDLLGHSLSAVSLKGDLAIRLLATDPDAARAEIASLVDAARVALRDVRAVAADEHAVSLQNECEAAAGLLGAAGIDVRVSLDAPGLAPEVEEILAWAVREGATNVLRHSVGEWCTIAVGRDDGAVRLEMVNDGVQAPPGERRGLVGLAARAAAQRGTVVGSDTGDGRFSLVVQIPEVVA